MAYWLGAGFLLYLFITTQSALTARRMVDMTCVFDNTSLQLPSPYVRKFEMYLDANNTVEGGYWLQMEHYCSSTHTGTHMNAPCHFAKGRRCIDEIPIYSLVASAAVIDIRKRAEQNPDAEVEIEDLQNWENRRGQTLNKTIVMMLSGWGKFWPNRTAFFGVSGNETDDLHFPGLSPKAARWLVDNRRIYGFGTDAGAIDYGPSRDHQAQRTLYDANIYGLVSVANMDKIPIYGATLYVLPMKLGRSSGAPVRILASFFVPWPELTE